MRETSTDLLNQIIDKARTVGEGYLTIIFHDNVWKFIFGGGILIPNENQIITVKKQDELDWAFSQCLSTLDLQVNYDEYIQSDSWIEFANAAKKRVKNRCQLCNVSADVIKLHAHHRTYARLGHEDCADITVLCADCHAKHHDEIGKDK